MFFERAVLKSLPKSVSKDIKSFSLAEVMISLLIISIMMVVSAPMISKKVTMSNSDVQIKELTKKVEELSKQLENTPCMPDYVAGSESRIAYNGTAAENGWLSWYYYNQDKARRYLYINGIAVLTKEAYKYGDATTHFVPIKKGDNWRYTVGDLRYYPCRK